jgi:uncharacterized protein YndB with AHSA1/START domain
MKNTLKVTTPTDREIVMTRVFDAPRGLVFDAMARPELLQRWLAGPPGWSMTACEVDLKAGGAFRHVWRGPGGEEMRMHGVIREVVPPERIVRTETFDVGCEAQAGEQLGTLALTERGGKTTLTLTVLYPSKEARDAALASGMEHGVAAGYDRLDGLLAESGDSLSNSQIDEILYGR